MGNRLLLAAGGTGGHMFPAQALAENLKAQGWDIAMITDARGRKHAGKIPANPIIEVKAASITPRRPLAAILGTFKLVKGVMQARKFIQHWGPDVVAGFGGYPAFPTMRAAQAMQIPTIIHEQNAVLGRVNRVFASKALHVASGFSELHKIPDGANHVVTGNPMRGQVVRAIPKTYILPKDYIHILIVGGSLGAKIVSQTVPAAIALLPDQIRKRLKVVQQTRPEYQSSARAIYEEAGVEAICETFFSDIERHLSQAHYIIGRAGASSVSEIAVMGKPSLLVPLAIAMDDHQTANALSLARHNAADILPESEFTPERVKSTLEARLNDSNWLKTAATAARGQGRPYAAAELAKLVISVVK